MPVLTKVSLRVSRTLEEAGAQVISDPLRIASHQVAIVATAGAAIRYFAVPVKTGEKAFDGIRHALGLDSSKIWRFKLV